MHKTLGKKAALFCYVLVRAFEKNCRRHRTYEKFARHGLYIYNLLPMPLYIRMGLPGGQVVKVLDYWPGGSELWPQGFSSPLSLAESATSRGTGGRIKVH